MTQKQALQIFEEKRVRTVWDDETEKWYFSVVDVVGVLTESPNPQTYWRVLKKRLKDEGNETVTNCNGFKMVAPERQKEPVKSLKRNSGIPLSRQTMPKPSQQEKT